MLTLRQAHDLLRHFPHRYNNRLLGKVVWHKHERDVLRAALVADETAQETKRHIQRALELYAICVERRRHSRFLHTTSCRGCGKHMAAVHNLVNNIYCSLCVLEHKAILLQDDTTIWCEVCQLQPATHGNWSGNKVRCQRCATFRMLRVECTQSV